MTEMARTRATSRWTPPDADREAMRILSSNLLVAVTELANPVVLVTSAQPGEGKTTTCAGLAASLSKAHLRVVLVDMDLRHPDVHAWIGGHNEFGVVDVLLERRSLQDCLQFIEHGEGDGPGERGFYFLATGERAINPADLLSTRRTVSLFKALAAQADIVLMDTAPVLSVADTLVIGRMTAGALLVVEAGRTPIAALREAKDSLTRNQTRLLGVVLNKAEERSTLGHGHGYGGASNGSEPAAPHP